MRRQRGVTLPESFADIRASHRAAQHTRWSRDLRGVRMSGSSADYHVRSETDFLRMLELARDFDRNDAILPGVITRICDNVVGQDGFRVKWDTGDDELDKDLEARWKDWTNDPRACSWNGEFSFSRMEHLVLRQRIVEGDIFGVTRDEGTVQLVEAHRCRTPKNTQRNVVFGILLDRDRRRREYWFTKDDIDPSRPLERVRDIQAVPAFDDEGFRQVLHIYNPKRVTQTRGVTELSPIVDMVGMHDDIQTARLVQAQIVSCIAFIISQDDVALQDADERTGEQTTQTRSDGSIETIENIAPGLRIRTNPGEKIEGFSPNVPNPEFLEHVKMVLKIICSSLGVPLQMLLLDAEATNFSGWRGAMDQAKARFRRTQRDLAEQFHIPILRWKVAQWAADDRAVGLAANRSGVDLNRFRVIPPGWPYVQPEVEAKADSERVNGYQVSLIELAAEKSRDFEETARLIHQSSELLIDGACEVAARLSEKWGEQGFKVDWREVLNVRSAAERGSAAAAPANAPEEENDDEGSEESGGSLSVA